MKKSQTNKRAITKVQNYVKRKNITDPRKEQFLLAYFTPTSPTFSNAYQSALIAGFTESYAKNIGTSAADWIEDFKKELRNRIVNKAEHKLYDLLSSESDKVALDATKFSLSTLAKDQYSPKVIEEHNHTVVHQLDAEQVNRILTRMKPLDADENAA